MTAKSKFNPALALGCLTAAVALLAGVQSASAQATAPAAAPLTGAGSFPGSFLVPGTNTSLHVGGIIQFDMYDDLNERDGGDSAGVTSVPVIHNLAGGAAPAENGGTVRGIRLRANSTRPNIETRTPTDYGEVKTYWEIDWQGSQAQPSIASSGGGAAVASAGGNTGATPCCAEGDLTRLRQAYGTLGPWLFGQTNSNFADVDSFHDVLDGGGQIAEMTPVSIRLVQVRYTQLLPGGLSVSGSIEQPITYGAVGAPTGQAAPSGTLTTFNSYSSPTWSPQRLPAITLTTRIDQPWGHLGFHVAAQQLWETNLGSFAGAGNSVTANIPPGGHVSGYGYMALLSGHVNTFGKDKITFNLMEGQGAANYGGYDLIVGGSGAFGDGIICRTNAAAGTGIAQCGEPRLMAGSIGYSHWWTSTWRSGAAVGYAKVYRTSAEATMSAATLQNFERTQYQYLLNLQWSPTPQTNFGIEYEWYRRVVQDGAYGTHNRIETQAVFKF